MIPRMRIVSRAFDRRVSRPYHFARSRAAKAKERKKKRSPHSVCAGAHDRGIVKCSRQRLARYEVSYMMVDVIHRETRIDVPHMVGGGRPGSGDDLQAGAGLACELRLERLKARIRSTLVRGLLRAAWGDRCERN